MNFMNNKLHAEAVIIQENGFVYKHMEAVPN